MGEARPDVNAWWRVRRRLNRPILLAPPPARPDAFSRFDPALFAETLAAGLAPGQLARSETIVARMRALRVGGEFWRGGGWDQTLPAASLAAALLVATTYSDPFTGESSTPEAYVEQLGVWREALEENRTIACCVGMSLWKRRRMADFFRAGDIVPAFRRDARAAIRVARARNGAIAVWSTRMPPGLAELAASAAVKLIRIEDGFVRSRGLGSGLLPPASVIMDDTGIYYDPTGPSALERILNDTVLAPELLERARTLIDVLVARDITKYAAGDAPLTLPSRDGRRRILVPGQVADDLSVRLGGAGITDNLDLLTRIRTGNPDAFIVYRPHPDVDAGHRKGAIPDAATHRYADLVQRGGSMATLIGEVDEVHTLTSLAGFEALLRGKRVVTYGAPFYAGWGLTEDRADDRGLLLRRSRKLPIETLVAGALLLYSRYVDPVTKLRCGPEVLIDRLSDRSIWRPSMLMRGRQVQGWLRGKLVRLAQRGEADGRR